MTNSTTLLAALAVAGVAALTLGGRKAAPKPAGPAPLTKDPYLAAAEALATGDPDVMDGVAEQITAAGQPTLGLELRKAAALLRESGKA